MHAHSFGSAFRLATALSVALTPLVCSAASPVRLSGSLTGSVHDSAGVPQMGAVVQLYNRNDKLVDKVMTSAKGDFLFASLVPDIYSIKVTVASFVPAIRRQILVQPGMQSVLAVNLTSVLSSIELLYTARKPGLLMSDDWRWALRSTMTTRPVTRILAGTDISDPNQAERVTSAMFSDTRGLVKLSAGESSSPFGTAGAQPDLGTTFALATSVFGSTQLQLSGNFGYGLTSEVPTSGFRTSFSPSEAGPQIKLTVQQVGLPTRGILVNGGNTPPLRTMSLTTIDRLDLGDRVQLDYGASIDSVTYLDRLNYISPFARLTAGIGPGTLDLGYSSGAPPVDLLNAREMDGSLQADVAALSLLPRVSMRNGRAHVQRSENMEIGYRVQVGSRTYSVGAYHEFVKNGALSMATSGDLYMTTGDLLPELSSRGSVFNIGNYNRSGYTASVTQTMGDNFSATIAAGRGGVLTTATRELTTEDADELRGTIRRAQRLWARGIVTAQVPVTGTRILGSYEWSDARALTPGHVYLTQKIYPDTGLNVRVRQPLPGWGGLPGRLEATAELRNLLAQGYLPLSTSGGRTVILSNNPRAIRGGLAFIF